MIHKSRIIANKIKMLHLFQESPERKNKKLQEKLIWSKHRRQKQWKGFRDAQLRKRGNMQCFQIKSWRKLSKDKTTCSFYLPVLSGWIDLIVTKQFSMRSQQCEKEHLIRISTNWSWDEIQPRDGPLSSTLCQW